MKSADFDHFLSYRLLLKATKIYVFFVVSV